MITIRPATLEDAAGMMRAHNTAVFTNTKEAYPFETLNAWSPIITASMSDVAKLVASLQVQLARPDSIAFVAADRDDVYGFAMARGNVLLATYVMSNAEGHLGTRLLRQTEQRAFESAQSLVCDASLNAIPFYRRNGYRFIEHSTYRLRSGVKIPYARMKKDRPAPSPAR